MECPLQCSPPQQKKKARRRMEFKKRLALWCALIATASVIIPVALSLMDKQPISELFITIFGGCIGYMISYAGASTLEKASRNKHGLDADGNPLPALNQNLDDAVPPYDGGGIK